MASHSAKTLQTISHRQRILAEIGNRPALEWAAYVCVCVRVRVCMGVCVGVLVVSIHVCVCVCVCVYLIVRVPMIACSFVRACTRVRACLRVNARVYMFIPMFTHILLAGSIQTDHAVLT